MGLLEAFSWPFYEWRFRSRGFYVSPLPSPAGKPVSSVPPIMFLFALWANTFAHPAAHKNLVALETPTLLGFVLALRLWLAVIWRAHSPLYTIGP